VEVVNTKIVPGDINDFYYNLRNRKNWFYFCLHYYIFTLLRLRKWLPESFVRKEYLPVGDPTLNYFYGAIRKGESIKVDLNSLLLNSYEIYLSLYDRASFVLCFYQINEHNHITEPVEDDGFYLFRIRQKPTVKEKFVSDWVKIAVS